MTENVVNGLLELRPALWLYRNKQFVFADQNQTHDHRHIGEGVDYKRKPSAKQHNQKARGRWPDQSPSVEVSAVEADSAGNVLLTNQL